MSSDTTYQEYLGYLNNSSFKNAVAIAYKNIISGFSPNSGPGTDIQIDNDPVLENQLVFLSSSLGLIYTKNITSSSSTISVPNFTLPDYSIFYQFWNNSENITSWSQSVQSYLISNKGKNTTTTSNTTNSTTLVTQLSDVNVYSTYIMIALFSSTQYDSSSNITPYTVDLLNPVNNQTAVINIKNFLQNSNISSDNLQGCGNYPFDTSFETIISQPNQGFIDSMCIYYFQNYKSQASSKLSEEQVENSYRNLISQNRQLLGYCGCFTPITSIPGETTNGYSAFGDSPCDPLCTNPNSFSLYETTQSSSSSDNLSSGTIINPVPKTCRANFCIIDSANINSLNSNGTVNFNQACSGCQYSKDGCVCYVDVSTKDLINKIGNGKTGMTSQQNFNQNCGNNSVCFKRVNGVNQVVNCSTINTPATGSLFSEVTNGQTKITTPAYITDFFWFVVSIIFFLVVIFMYQISVYY